MCIEYEKQNGISLLEMLLVLFVIAGIGVFTINRYFEYNQQIEVSTVQRNVALIMDALNNYFHTEGCNQNGAFNGSFSPDLHNDLGLDASFKLHPPIVKQFSAEILDTGLKTKTDQPVYNLEIQAELNSKYSSAQIHWYQLKLNAASSQGANLLWTQLPSYNSDDHEFWILNADNEEFRQKFHSPTLPAFSNCAQ